MDIPSPWRPIQIDTHHLLLADQDRPVFEIKWAFVSGRFVPEKRLGAWRRQQRLALEIQPGATAWSDCLQGFDTTVFNWRKAHQSGRGALLYCPVCGQATWLQFFNPVDPDLCLKLIESLRDHTTDPMQRVAVFDIAARIPANFKLASYQFDTGRFFIDFEQKEQRLSLMRWGPANALLANAPLAEAATKLIPLPLVAPEPIDNHNPATLQWRQQLIGKRWLIRPTAGQDWLRLWHLQPANRLLAVRWHSPRKPIDNTEFEMICHAYQVV